MSTQFDPELAFENRAQRADKKSRLQVKQEKVGKRLANYATRQANEGFVGEEVKAQTRRFLGHAAFIHDHADEIYTIANGHLAEEGLHIAETSIAWHPGRGYVSTPQARDFGFMTISVTSQAFAKPS